MEWSKEILTVARKELLEVIDEPVRTGDIFEKLNYSSFDFMITEGIGDNRSDWHMGPHRQVLGELVEDGTIVWWEDDEENNWYAQKGKKP